MNIKKVTTGALAGILGLSSISGLAFGGNASAVDLTSKIQAKNLFGGDVASFVTTYDAETDVTTLETTIYLNDTAIESILAQKSGKGSSLGMGYIELKPNIDSSVARWYKENAYFYSGTDIDTEKAKVQDLLNADMAKGVAETRDYDTIWPIGAYVLYNDGEKFAVVPGDGDSKTSVEDALRSALNKSTGELEYGIDFKVGMYTGYEWLNGWIAADADGNVAEDAKPVYILSTYKVTYPIAGVVNKSENYYKSLPSALAGEESKVIVREDVTLDGDLVVPEDKTLEIAKDATIALPAGASVSGTVTGEGKVTIGGIDADKVATGIKLGTGEEEITINTKDTTYLQVIATPSDVAVDYELTNSDSDVVAASVECKYNEGEEETGKCTNILTLDGLSEGEAILTVTDKNSGKSATVKVIVEKEFDFGGESIEEGTVYVDFETPIKGDLRLDFDTVDYTVEELAEKSEFLKAVFDISLVDNATDNAVSVKDNKIGIDLILHYEDYKDMKYFKIAYIDADGKIAEVFDPEVHSNAEDGYIVLSFTTTHLSQYGVLASETELPEILTPDTGIFTRSESSSLDYRGLVATVTALTVTVIAMSIALKKRGQIRKW